jgi:hypothetical protein
MIVLLSLFSLMLRCIASKTIKLKLIEQSDSKMLLSIALRAYASSFFTLYHEMVTLMLFMLLLPMLLIIFDIAIILLQNHLNAADHLMVYL